ncbi:MAG TPA: hypothetical protein VIK89_11290 [Cytophagaceae bacterium]
MKTTDNNILASFLIKYSYAKNRAKSIMESGDLNNYLKQLFELNKFKTEVKDLLPKTS